MRNDNNNHYLNDTEEIIMDIENTKAYKFVSKHQNINGQIWDWCDKLDHEKFADRCFTESGEQINLTQNQDSTDLWRYEWDDGSAIVTADGAWDFGVHRDKQKSIKRPTFYQHLTKREWRDEIPFVWPEAIPEMSEADSCPSIITPE